MGAAEAWSAFGLIPKLLVPYLKFEPLYLKSGRFSKVENGIGFCWPSKEFLHKVKFRIQPVGQMKEGSYILTATGTSKVAELAKEKGSIYTASSPCLKHLSSYGSTV